MTSSSSFVLLALVAAVGIGCVAINNLQLLSSSSSMVEVGTALSGSGNVCCPLADWSFLVLESGPFDYCVELYFEFEDQMEEELQFIQIEDPDNKKGFLPRLDSCKDRNYTIPYKIDHGKVDHGGHGYGSACYSNVFF